jgi:hypothetical protein
MRRGDLHGAIVHLAKALIELEAAEAAVARQEWAGQPDAGDWRPGDYDGLVVASALVVGALTTLKDVRGGLRERDAVRTATLATWQREITSRTHEPVLRKHFGDRGFEERYAYGADGRLHWRPDAPALDEGAG